MKILTKENGESVVRFQKYFLNQIWKKMLKLAWLPALFIIICLIFDSYFFAGFIFVMYLVLVISFPLINKKSSSDLNKSNKAMMENKLCEYEINENDFIVKAYQGDDMISMVKYKYQQVFKVEESQNDFYIFIANNQAFCIDKSDIDSKDIDELRGILQSKISNYKINFKGE